MEERIRRMMILENGQTEKQKGGPLSHPDAFIHPYMVDDCIVRQLNLATLQLSTFGHIVSLSTLYRSFSTQP